MVVTTFMPVAGLAQSGASTGTVMVLPPDGYRIVGAISATVHQLAPSNCTRMPVFCPARAWFAAPSRVPAAGVTVTAPAPASTFFTATILPALGAAGRVIAMAPAPVVTRSSKSVALIAVLTATARDGIDQAPVTVRRGTVVVMPPELLIAAPGTGSGRSSRKPSRRTPRSDTTVRDRRTSRVSIRRRAG